jgi:hypothetical protein
MDRPRRYTFAELEAATGGFARGHILGFGTVYRGERKGGGHQLPFVVQTFVAHRDVLVHLYKTERGGGLRCNDSIVLHGQGSCRTAGQWR